MKSLLIGLLMTLIVSTNVQAKKVAIIATNIGVMDEDVGDESCEYKCDDNQFYGVSYHAHAGISLMLQVLVDGQDDPLMIRKIDFTSTHNGSKYWCKSKPFSVQIGESWTLVWVIQRTSSKHRVIDVREMASGTCPE